MPELTPRERLQPSLLDRLTDDEPKERRESREKRVLSPGRLRESVVRDLGWLLNTTNLASVQDFQGHPEVARSVLNYGLGDLAGKTASGTDAAVLEEMLRQAIVAFEPRLLASSVRVSMTSDRAAPTQNNLTFVVEAQLWSQPIPLRLHLKTEVDLEDGDVRLAELRDISEPLEDG
jgi:type VI secretion system protein ImpF